MQNLPPSMLLPILPPHFEPTDLLSVNDDEFEESMTAYMTKFQVCLRDSTLHPVGNKPDNFTKCVHMMNVTENYLMCLLNESKKQGPKQELLKQQYDKLKRIYDMVQEIVISEADFAQAYKKSLKSEPTDSSVKTETE